MEVIDGGCPIEALLELHPHEICDVSSIEIVDLATSGRLLWTLIVRLG